MTENKENETSMASSDNIQSNGGEKTNTTSNTEPTLEDIDEDDLEIKEDGDWDEGGPSHCGYHETIHNALMGVGQSIHKIVGDPSPGTEESLKSVGAWFQEASYATRDIMRGQKVDLDPTAGVDEEVAEKTKADEAAQQQSTSAPVTEAQKQ
eukprot:CAMPEP_0194027500 /NCGR_PEP_ID=MMETSP0009_2-20130614/1647_1 /TAXON_ID=210454 /ORGANISM="Grammatophora oceanica, Strain CCMP 410" /LENGTH=151 /DNA_ID=CAMNT_0038666591 /DNA_START=105 /DNA_END=560 /DNA_ORIENTATION=+